MATPHEQIVAAIRDIYQRVKAIESKVKRDCHTNKAHETPTSNRSGVLYEVVKALQAASAMVVVVMIVWIISLLPNAANKLKAFVDSLPSGTYKSLMTSTISITSEKGKPALTLSHAIMFRIPALPDSPESRAKYEKLHAMLRDYGGWNRWKIDRQSDKPANGVSIEEKYMYSLALIPAHATEAPSRINRELGQLFGEDKLIMTYSLNDANLSEALITPPK